MREDRSKSPHLLHPILRKSQNHRSRRASLIHTQMNHPSRRSHHLSLRSRESQSLRSGIRHPWVIGKNVGQASPWSDERRICWSYVKVKMNRMRLRISERLKQSQNTAASLTTFNEVDMSNLIQFRKLYKDELLKKTGVKLGFMSAFSRACILGMRDIPAVNASIEGPGGGDTIVYRDYVDISVAVATEKGLVTPVVRNTEALDLVGIEKAIAELGKKVRTRSVLEETVVIDDDTQARDNKLTIEDMAGGTFTISNVSDWREEILSSIADSSPGRSLRLVDGNTNYQLTADWYGALHSTVVWLTNKDLAVLGLHAIKEKPVAIYGKVEIRPVRTLLATATTFDWPSARWCISRSRTTTGC